MSEFKRISSVKEPKEQIAGSVKSRFKRRGLSIKQRVVFFYSAVIIVLVMAFGAFLFYTAQHLAENISRATLEEVVKSASDNVSHYSGRIVIEPDMDFFASGASIMLYNSSGVLIAGSPPSTFPQNIPLVNDEYRSIQGEHETFMTYDLNVLFQDSNIWIRGIYSMNNNIATFQSMALTAGIALPLLLAVAIFTGYMITKRAFAPVSRIVAAAERINHGRDLSKRIEPPQSRDELYELTVTLNDMIARLERAFENERQFTSDASHELKTPLSVIRAQCEYALSPDCSPKEREECLHAIYRQQSRMSALTEQLLELSRGLDYGSLLKREPVNLHELCSSVLADMQPMADEREIKILTRLDNSITVDGDRTLLSRMFINLISNALRYGRDGGFIMITLEREGESVKLSVADNGIGVRPENINKVFNRFFREDAARSGSTMSFGLGLSFVKWVAQAHGGDVTLESVKDVGSTFIVRISKEPDQKARDKD